MKALFFILNKEEYLEEILEAFLEMNIPGATVLDSMGMGSILTKEIPIFAGFKSFFQDTQPGNKTIITVLPDNQVESAVKVIEQVIGSLNDPGSGLVFTLTLDAVYGYNEPF